MNAAIARRRLLNQRITGEGWRQPDEAVDWCGAVQAQEYEAAKWGLGLRMADGTTESDVERALDQGRILRTHVMRPTWHFVTRDSIRWLLDLTAPRVHRRLSVYHRRLELDAPTLVRATTVFERALSEGSCLTRAELAERLRRSRLTLAGIRLALVTIYAELEGVICSGPRRGRQFTYALLPNRAPGARGLPGDEALAELVRRYFRSHGPATIRDFVWWSGVSTAEAKRGLEMINARSEEIDARTYWYLDSDDPGLDVRGGAVHLLPIYDEYLVAYRDRDAVPYGPAWRMRNKTAIFPHPVVMAGQVAGTWGLRRGARLASMAVTLGRLTARQRRALEEAVRRYERFRNESIDLKLSKR
jgi:winged helix DNA-binding protein